MSKGVNMTGRREKSMRIRYFAHGIASVLFALVAAAPLTAMAASIFVDESIEGQPPGKLMSR